MSKDNNNNNFFVSLYSTFLKTKVYQVLQHKKQKHMKQ